MAQTFYVTTNPGTITQSNNVYVDPFSYFNSGTSIITMGSETTWSVHNKTELDALFLKTTKTLVIFSVYFIRHSSQFGIPISLQPGSLAASYYHPLRHELVD